MQPNSYTIDYNCTSVLMTKKKRQIFRSVSNERRIQCSNISSQLSHLLRYFCAYSFSIIHTLYPVLNKMWIIYCKYGTPKRTIEKANTNLHVEQWIRSVQLNTNLLPLTCNNINVSMPFLPPFLFDRNYNNFFKIERIPLRLCSLLLFLYVLFSSFRTIVLKTIYRHRLNRSKAT